MTRWHGAQTAVGISRGDLSCAQPWQLPGANLPGGQDEGGFSEMPGRNLREDRLAGACVVRDVEPLPLGGGNSTGQPGGGNTLFAGDVFDVFQPVAAGAGGSVPRPLQEPAG